MEDITILKKVEDTVAVQVKLLALIPEFEKGKVYECIIKKHSEKRSLNANSYFHLLVNKIAKVLNIGNDEAKIKFNLEYGTVAKRDNGEDFIIKLPEDAVITQFYDYAKYIGSKVESGLKLDYYMFYKQTHTLDNMEMARLIDGVVYEAQQLGIETKTPEELAKLKALWASDPKGGAK